MLVTTSQIDPLLLPFLAAGDVHEEAAALNSLNNDHVEPVVRRVLGIKLRFYSSHGGHDLQRAEFEEISNDIQLRLLKRLRTLKHEPAANQILNFCGYVATVTRNTADEYLRRKYPLRRSLKDKVRRHLLSRSEFALWENDDHNCLAGLFEWQHCDRTPKDMIGSQLEEQLREKWRATDVQRLSLHELLTTIFAVADMPLDLDHLTVLVAGFWGVKDHAPEQLEANASASLGRQAGADTSLATIVEQRELLKHLWREICQLPRRQRLALLLNLRTSHGINVITLFPATNVATFEEIARALEIPSAEFEQLWADLPLDDLRIGAYLGATRQQVINLRKTARERLVKRISTLNLQKVKRSKPTETGS